MKLSLILLIILTLFSCDSSTESKTVQKEYEKEAFDSFEDENYEDAEDKFIKALESGNLLHPDSVLAGLGLVQIRLYKYESALTYIDSALSINPNMTEALFGKSLIEYAFKNYSETIRLGNLIISNTPNWAFSYDKSLNINDVYLHVSMAYYQLKEYQNSYNTIVNVSNPSFNLSDPELEKKLGLLLENLILEFD